jgi:hypothetical protein
MEKPKLDEKKFLHCVATGEADEYLAAHSERAPVFAPWSDKPHAYDVILDPEASNELFRSYTQGKRSLQDATQEELRDWVDSVAGGCDHQHYENPWKAVAIRSLLIIGATVVFITVMTLAIAHR